MKPEWAARLVPVCKGAAAVAGCIGYSLLAHLAAAAPAPGLFEAAVAVAPGLTLAFLLAWRSARRPLLLALWGAGCLGLYGASGWLVGHYHWVFLLQDAGLQVLLGLMFGRTLRPGQTPLVSQFAALLHGSLSPAAVRYTRRATWAWTLFFAGMATLSLLLFWLASIAVWSVFANLLGLPLVVLMFVAEYAVRLCVVPQAERAGLWEAFAAYRQSSPGLRRRAH
ncbi:hypothetical protein [Polaromonas sp. C04]|uniref:COG4648 family protein n=1 Tax=Polaromonas sp. C04 TaxID=1945857 RepID=UPI000986FCDC|nr:hypothetical protein [Polaromonas sp. C04]